MPSELAPVVVTVVLVILTSPPVALVPTPAMPTMPAELTPVVETAPLSIIDVAAALQRAAGDRDDAARIGAGRGHADRMEVDIAVIGRGVDAGGIGAAGRDRAAGDLDVGIGVGDDAAAVRAGGGRVGAGDLDEAVVRRAADGRAVGAGGRWRCR